MTSVALLFFDLHCILVPALRMGVVAHPARDVALRTAFVWGAKMK